jgi:hypothetical protein
MFVRSRSKARKSLYFSACNSLCRLEERESITYKSDIKGSSLIEKSLQNLLLGDYSQEPQEYKSSVSGMV